ncbi:hypothetical protein [Chryseobacterium sp. BIGb0232]|nr:hypothetical protein [Chryseobacterium sp. BIGb0232]MCS4302488.1 hypothetical protein [Chryseobacterium sp. BIGb0232]
MKEELGFTKLDSKANIWGNRLEAQFVLLKIKRSCLAVRQPLSSS